MKLSPALALAAFALAPSAAARADACHVAAYLPAWVGWVISAELPRLHVVALQSPDFVPTDAPVIPTGKATLVRQSRIVGTTLYTEDTTHGKSSFVVNDAAGKPLFELHVDVSVCHVPGHPGGLCKTVTARTSLEPTSPTGGEPLELRLGPDQDELPLYYRYGDLVDFAAYHHAFADMVNWLEKSLQVTTSTVTPDLSTPEQKAYWALASDPDVAPYLPHLSFTASAVGGVAVYGELPSVTLLDDVTAALAGVGYASPDLRLAIDPSVQIPRLNQDKLLPCAIN